MLLGRWCESTHTVDQGDLQTLAEMQRVDLFHSLTNDPTPNLASHKWVQQIGWTEKLEDNNRDWKKMFDVTDAKKRLRSWQAEKQVPERWKNLVKHIKIKKKVG